MVGPSKGKLVTAPSTEVGQPHGQQAEVDIIPQPLRRDGYATGPKNNTPRTLKTLGLNGCGLVSKLKLSILEEYVKDWHNMFV